MRHLINGRCQRFLGKEKQGSCQVRKSVVHETIRSADTLPKLREILTGVTALLMQVATAPCRSYNSIRDREKSACQRDVMLVHFIRTAYLCDWRMYSAIIMRRGVVKKQNVTWLSKFRGDSKYCPLGKERKEACSSPVDNAPETCGSGPARACLKRATFSCQAGFFVLLFSSSCLSSCDSSTPLLRGKETHVQNVGALFRTLIVSWHMCHASVIMKTCKGRCCTQEFKGKLWKKEHTRQRRVRQ